MRNILSNARWLLSTQLVATKGYLQSIQSKPESMDKPIDFVVTWVDGNDLEWRNEKAKFDSNCAKGNTDARYREWNQFVYWFRAVEKFAPWVRYVHLITWGHLPTWLNLNHPKLKIVNHKDYIPSKYLPTFNSIPIELNMHRIPDLSEHFVYFNDDMYLASPVTPEDFFSAGKPRCCAIAAPVRNYRYNGPFAHQLFTNVGMINSVFDFCSAVENHPNLWFSKCYKERRRLNLNAYRDTYLPGMYFSHLGVPFCKSTIEKVWDILEKELDETCSHKFRTSTDIMHQIISLWDIMEGNFYPVDQNYFGIKFGTLSKEIPVIRKAFTEGNYRMICLNDSVDITEENFPQIKAELDSILFETFSQKSSFEKR